MLPLVAVTSFMACDSDDEESGVVNPADIDDGAPYQETVVTVDANGKADGGHRFSKIDDASFYIDDIIYTVKNNSLEVTGYGKGIGRSARIISRLNYKGRSYDVVRIGDEAFKGCSSISSVGIPRSVTSIGGLAFTGCSGLTAVHIYDLAAWCNIAFQSTPLSYAHHLYVNGEETKDLVIPSKVARIGNLAFSELTGLNSVIIPEGVASIGSRAFQSCSSLTSVHIPESMVIIGEEAFWNCSGLTSIVIPKGLTSIGEHAFSACSNLNSIVVEEGNPKYDSRGGCNAIIRTASNTLIAGCMNSTIPSGVTGISWDAFAYCTGLNAVTIPGSVTSIGSSAFDGCSGLKSINIPDGVTSIGSNAFSGCTGLTAVSIPESVTSIGSYAFANCSSLTSITIPATVVNIGSSTFSGCASLNAVSIPHSVIGIGSNAFCGCQALTSIRIPVKVKSIGKWAFDECNSLTSVTMENDAPPSIHSSTFSARKNATLYVPKGSKAAYQKATYWKEFKEIIEVDK